MTLLIVFCFVAVALTVAMFVSRNPMLGFPSAMFWALFGGQAYVQSTAAWDMYFLVAFASLLGMVTFCAFGAYGLREKKDSRTDEDEYIDEKGSKESYYDEAKPEPEDDSDGFFAKSATTKASQNLRERAEKRRLSTKIGRRYVTHE